NINLPWPDCTILDPAPLNGTPPSCQVTAAKGHASVAYIQAAVSEVQAGRAHAFCTAPISKEAIKLAGVEFPGHTEMLASLCGIKEVRMMLVGGGLQAVLQTIHIALKDVPAAITTAGILDSLRIIRQFARQTGTPSPRIAVCGLNPHAGEAGHFGREEIDVIDPALTAARAEGI